MSQAYVKRKLKKHYQYFPLDFNDFNMFTRYLKQSLQKKCMIEH